MTIPDPTLDPNLALADQVSHLGADLTHLLVHAQVVPILDPAQVLDLAERQSGRVIDCVGPPRIVDPVLRPELVVAGLNDVPAVGVEAGSRRKRRLEEADQPLLAGRDRPEFRVVLVDRLRLDGLRFRRVALRAPPHGLRRGRPEHDEHPTVLVGDEVGPDARRAEHAGIPRGEPGSRWGLESDLPGLEPIGPHGPSHRGPAPTGWDAKIVLEPEPDAHRRRL